MKRLFLGVLIGLVLGATGMSLRADSYHYAAQAYDRNGDPFAIGDTVVDDSGAQWMVGGFSNVSYTLSSDYASVNHTAKGEQVTVVKRMDPPFSSGTIIWGK